MSELQFQIKGLTKDELQRARQRDTHAGSLRRFVDGLSIGLRALVWAAIAVGSLYLLQWINAKIPRLDSADTRSVVLNNGSRFYGNNVIVLQDASGSMRNTGDQLKSLLTQLSVAGISVDNPIATMGPGFSVVGTSENSLHKLEQGLQVNSAADAIFVFSDFANDDAEWDAHDEAGYERLRELLDDGRRRLYLGTVTYPPPAELLKIAYDSGGGMIEAKVSP